MGSDFVVERHSNSIPKRLDARKMPRYHLFTAHRFTPSSRRDRI
jgi:hypothetical protein